ncbi:MAG: hypothetical protein ISN64_03415 [Rickettsia sp.]|nr:hypothetical protein [Rickettsia sp.]
MQTFACKESSGRRFFDVFFQKIEKKMPNLKQRYFEVDRNRIIYSNAFRNLQHKNTTLNYYGDLNEGRNIFAKTASLGYLTRSLGSLLNVNADLSEVIALTSGLAVPTFGNAGEIFAKELSNSQESFVSSFYAFKIVTQIENLSIKHSGMNLSREVLESILKCDNAFKTNKLPGYIVEYRDNFNLDLSSNALLECQVFTVIRDFISVINDLEDALRFKLISIKDFYESDSLIEYAQILLKKSSNLDNEYLIFEIGRILIHEFFEDVVFTTTQKISNLKIVTLDDVRNSDKKIVCISPKQLQKLDKLKQFLIEKIHMTPKVIFVMKKLKRILYKLYHLYKNDLSLLPQKWQRMIQNHPDKQNQIVLDYILYMNDNFAIMQYKRFFNLESEEMNFLIQKLN